MDNFQVNSLDWLIIWKYIYYAQSNKKGGVKQWQKVSLFSWTSTLRRASKDWTSSNAQNVSGKKSRCTTSFWAIWCWAMSVRPWRRVLSWRSWGVSLASTVKSIPKSKNSCIWIKAGDSPALILFCFFFWFYFRFFLS